MKWFYQDSSRVKDEDLKHILTSLQEYSLHLKDISDSKTYEAPESSINLPSDTALIETVLTMKKAKVTSKLKYIIDIGIGGSNLGTKAVYDALFGHYDILEPERTPKIFFLDTTADGVLTKVMNLLSRVTDKEEFIVNAISKSGGTTETIANFEVIFNVLISQFGEEAKDKVVITTDEGSNFWHEAVKQKIDVLPIPKQVGGRFSVLSPVGLFPLACCGINIESLLAGAADMKSRCLASDMTNPAAISAAITYFHSKNGKNITDSFFFLPQLESIGKWYRQLTGESLGKEQDLNGNAVHAGITPTVSIGSTDLHSVGQLYLGGPRDKMTTFVYSTEKAGTISVPSQLRFPLVQGIENKKMPEIMYAIREGVKVAYNKQELPYFEIALDKVDAYELGAFLQFKMIEMMFLGKLINVNTFDQPHVELYKTETKKILLQQ